jgi:SAM-dependent methyltransferase
MPFEDDNQYEAYYREAYPPTGKEYVAKDYKHDQQVADARFKSCDIRATGGITLLDVGSGSGAFVEHCRTAGIEAWGCEIGKYVYSRDWEDDYIYRRRLEDVHFPTDHFDCVTCFDVLEHVMDARSFLREMFRITKQKGQCFIEVPDYFGEQGKYHWKKGEHVWFFTREQLEHALESVGFIIAGTEYPIPGKILICATKPMQRRTRVLLPPGIGDSYWSLIKLESFLEREEIEPPVDAYVACNRSKAHNGHKRAFPFISMFPFVCATGVSVGSQVRRDDVWQEAYARRGRTIFRDVYGCDFFISYNGHLRFGESMEEIDPDLECNWRPPRFISLEEDQYRRRCADQYGDYIVYYFVFHGTYRHWTKEFDIKSVAQYVRGATEKYGCTPVFAGAIWDGEEATLNHLVRQVPGTVDLRGKTNMGQVFGLMRGARAVVGYPSGLTILGAVLDCPTLIVWNKYYNRQFFWECCPPDTRNKTYLVEDTGGLTAERLVERTGELLTGKAQEPVVKPTPQAQPPRAVPTVACVLRSGGDFIPDHVRVLHEMVRERCSLQCDFVSLTDMGDMGNGIRTVELQRGEKSWWSKVELFRLTGPVLYLDLDVIITGELDALVHAVWGLKEDEVLMLTPFNRQRRHGDWASAIMGWNGSHRVVVDGFDPSLLGHGVNEQMYVASALEKSGVKIRPVQDHIRVSSYKRHIQRGVKPENTDVVCFHGRPRPWEAASKDPWVRGVLRRYA